jgi:hypothetical protein
VNLVIAKTLFILIEFIKALAASLKEKKVFTILLVLGIQAHLFLLP